MARDPKITASEVVGHLGGPSNIKEYTNCLTRFRVRVNNSDNVDLNAIKNNPNVMGVVEKNGQLQIILGPSFVDKVVAEVKKQFPELVSGGFIDENLDNELQKNSSQDLAAIAKTNKSNARPQGGVQIFLSKFAEAFAPLIWSFIGTGLLCGLAGILSAIWKDVPLTDAAGELTGKTGWSSVMAESWFNIITVSMYTWKEVFMAIAGFRIALVFGGVPIAGAVLAAMFMDHFSGIFLSPFIPILSDTGIVTGFNFLGIHIMDPLTNWLTIGWRPAGDATTGYSLGGPNGNLFGALMLAFLSVPVAKFFTRVIPEVVEVVFVPVATVFVMTFAGYFVIVPIAGMMFSAVTWITSLAVGNPLVTALIAFLFSWMVVFGLHQGMVPIYLAGYSAMVAEYGEAMIPLLAITILGGMGQVGAAIGLYFKAPKGSNVKQAAKFAIIPGILGVGEPILFGLSLPRPKIMLSGMLGSAVGGFTIGMLTVFGVQLGIASVGPSGIFGIPTAMALINGTVGHQLVAIPLYTGVIALTIAAGTMWVYIIGVKGVDLS